MRRASTKDCGWIVTLLKQMSEHGLMIMHRFLWEAMGSFFFCTAKYILFLSMFNSIKEFRTIFRDQSL